MYKIVVIALSSAFSGLVNNLILMNTVFYFLNLCLSDAEIKISFSVYDKYMI